MRLSSHWATTFTSMAGGALMLTLVLLLLALTPHWKFPAYIEPAKLVWSQLPRRRLMGAGLAWAVAHEMCLQNALEQDQIHCMSQSQVSICRAKAMLENPNTHVMINGMDATLHRASASVLADRFVSRLPPEGILCVGEEHDSPLHHAAELRLLQALRRATPSTTPLALGVEMLVQCDDHRQALHDFALGSSLSELYNRTNWRKTWGYDIGFYADILEYARASEIQIVPLNCPPSISTFVKMFGAKTMLGHGEHNPGFPGIDLFDPVHREHFMKTFFTAQGRAKLPFTQKQNQYEAHTVREEFMAAGAAFHQKTSGGRLMILSGRSHVEGRHGIPDRIHRRLAKHGCRAPTTMMLQNLDLFQQSSNLAERQDSRYRTSSHMTSLDWLWFTDAEKSRLCKDC